MSQTMSLADHVDAQLAGDGKALPVFSPVAAKLQRMLTSGEFEMSAVTQLIAGEATLSAEILRVANSARYRGLEAITTIRDAMMRLGAREVASLALLASQKGSFQSRDPGLQEMMKKLWPHGVACAIGSRWLAKRCNCDDLADEAFLAGLLHDVGKLMLLRVVDDMIASDNCDFEPTKSFVAELLDTLHAEKGALLLAKWEIPERYIQVARDHHAPELDVSNDLTAIIRLVDRACHKIGIGVTQEPDLVLAALPEAQCLGVGEIDLAELEILLEDALKVA